MPFALNEATQYINPTKTLEYMAAGKPIVSTAVPGCDAKFTPMVSVRLTSHDEFIAGIRETLRSRTLIQKLIAQGIECAANASWEPSSRHARAYPRRAARPYRRQRR